MNSLMCLNLTKNDAEICGLLITFGELTLGEFEKLTSIHRRNIYDSLNRLIVRGFASCTSINGKSVYHISDPKKISSELSKKQKEIANLIPQIGKFSKKKKNLNSSLARRRYFQKNA